MFRRLATLLLVVASAYVSAHLVTIGQGWEVVLEVGAGTGGVYLLRWYWWRINAWSEISAMATALIMTLALHRWPIFTGSAPVIFAKTTLTTTAVTTAVWVLVTFLTPPEPDEVLLRFYRKVRPHAAGWRRIAALAPELPQTRDLGQNLLAWLLGCAMVYAALIRHREIVLRADCGGRRASCAGHFLRRRSLSRYFEARGSGIRRGRPMQRQRRTLSKQRLEAFTDGVVADHHHHHGAGLEGAGRHKCRSAQGRIAAVSGVRAQLCRTWASSGTTITTCFT